MASHLQLWLTRRPELVSRLTSVSETIARRRERHLSYDQRFEQQAARIEKLQKRLDGWTLAAARSRVEYTTAAHQITSFEQRLAALEETQVDGGDEPARAEARDIVAEVRTEHARVRARLTMLGAYEERLRRVEAALLHAIRVEEFPTPPQEAVGADIIEARLEGRIAPDATSLPPLWKKALKR